MRLAVGESIILSGKEIRERSRAGSYTRWGLERQSIQCVTRMSWLHRSPSSYSTACSPCVTPETVPWYHALLSGHLVRG